MHEIYVKLTGLIAETETHFNCLLLSHRERNQYLRILVDSMINMLQAANVPLCNIERFRTGVSALIPVDPLVYPLRAKSITHPTTKENIELLQAFRTFVLNSLPITAES